MRNLELETIQKKILEGEEREVSGIELIAYILGSCTGGESSIAVAEDLLSYFGGWDRFFNAKRSELEKFKQLESRQIEVILALGRLEKIMKTIEN